MRPAPKCKSILVLCEGNICRSPMAVGLLRAALEPGFLVESAGLGARDGYPADPEAVRLMAGRGLDITGHLSRKLTEAMALAADLILVMDLAQQDWCTSQAPSVRGRVFLLGQWQRSGAVEIADPFQRGPEAFLATFELIDQCVSAWVPHLASRQRLA